VDHHCLPIKLQLQPNKYTWRTNFQQNDNRPNY
jgi:hypothetical protein